MKKVFFLTVCLGTFTAVTYTAAAQEDKADRDRIENKKQEEIIIRKHGDTDSKLTIEMKGDDVLINGKQLSEFNDSDLTVIKRNGTTFRGNDMLIAPRGGNSFFYNNGNWGEPRPLLGVTTEKNDKGAKINEVTKGSAAEKGRFKGRRYYY